MVSLSAKNNQKGPASPWASQGGQILLVVVLAVVVSLTVGLSAVSRTITNTKLSTEEANSQRSLSAAEAGVEKLLANYGLEESSGSLSNKAGFDANAEAIVSDDVEVNGSVLIKKDEGADVWLSNVDFSGGQWGSGSPKSLSIYWTDNDNLDCTKNAAIVVSVLSGTDKNNPILTSYAYDACAGRSSGFDNPGAGTSYNGRTYQHGFSINIVSGFIARIIPVYADTYIYVQGDGLPSQGRIISSVGTSGDTSRKIRVYQGNPRIPIEFFPYNLFLP